MICRTCLRRASGFASPAAAAVTRPMVVATSRAAFSTTFSVRTPPAATPAAAAPATSTAEAGLAPVPGAATTEQPKASISSCPAGTKLNGLNYFKNKADPVALPDEEYPEWLWRCLEVQKKTDDAADADAGDEFSKSKKQRRLAMKRARAQEAKLLASGDLEALAPKIPLQKQSVNLPGAVNAGVADAVVADEKREELRKAMRKERKAKIKESNYLKAM
ncbi:mitochondrial ribosomal protein L37-domain-containing protein [Neurospora tetraspora]|uniref:Large ribosomal subunit protein mL54 n=1 Tax=Neurospora tetraspora TaxID=94610 RepID=A0AAE0JNZ3_9PEZI|nr:mitochondrial ribosomal protein L37-domain-containing protein [Neurospora tetraspora]